MMRLLRRLSNSLHWALLGSSAALTTTIAAMSMAHIFGLTLGSTDTLWILFAADVLTLVFGMALYERARAAP